MTTPSEVGRALAALRSRTTICCEVCGKETEAWLRGKSQPSRTCSPKCRQQLYRDRKRAATTTSATTTTTDA